MGFVGKYETLEQIGTGSMGSVYRARDIVLDREVALKILNKGHDLDAELRERFFREGRAGAKLLHPNIAIIYDLGEANGVPYIAMELLNGADLRRYVQEQRPMSLAQKVEFAAQVCDGLAHAHRHDIIHRDIKPSNIFIHEERQAKVLDFGVARLPSSKLTVVGTVVGTPNYMAPEQVMRRSCDARSDIFAAAIVFFEFLVYAHPFQSIFIPRRIAEELPDNLSDHDPLIPKSLEKLLRHALENRPESRIQTAEELAAGLRAVGQELRTGLATLPTVIETSPKQGAGAMSAQSGPTADADSSGWRVSEFIILLREFDDSLALERLAAAKSTLEQMRGLDAVDGRFAVAIRDCETRLASAESAPPTDNLASAASAGTASAGVTSAPAPASAPKPPSSLTRGHEWSARSTPAIDPWDDTSVFQVGHNESADAVNTPRAPVTSTANEREMPPVVNACPTCGSENRDNASYCRNCGEALAGAKPQERVIRDFVTARPPLPIRLRAHITEIRRRLTPASKNIRHYSGQFLVQPPGWKWVVGIVLAVVLAAIGVTTLALPRPVPVEKSIGQAEVIASVTDLLERPVPSSKRLMILRSGTPVNVIGPMNSRDQSFVRVQFVSPKRDARPGFVRATHLGKWSSSDPKLAWDFVQLSRPDDGASDADVRRFIDELRAYERRFPVSPLISTSELEQARLDVALAKRGKTAGQPLSSWEADLNRAKQALATAAADSTKAGAVAALRQEFEALSAAVVPPPPATLVQVEDILHRMQALWDAGDYWSVINLAKQVETMDPGNAQAKRWDLRARRAIWVLRDLNQ